MTAFKQIFSVTWKVLLSLLIISILVVIVAVRLNEVGQKRNELKYYEQYDRSYYHTSMPKSEWDKKVAFAVKHHCTFAGMSRQEVITALGPPAAEKPANEYGVAYLEYPVPAGSQGVTCLKYSGDTCVDYIDKPRIWLEHGYQDEQYANTRECTTLEGKEVLGLP